MEGLPDRGHAPLRAVVVGDGLACSLEEAALVLARQEYPDLDPRPHLARLDAIADLARPMLSTEPDPPEVLGVVNDVLFRDLGFHGNSDDYYDPRNSYLNDVLERRTGIPISLAVVHMAVARRLGLELRGTAFPGHFLTTQARPGWPIVIDAFDRGRVLSQAECARLATAAGSVEWDASYLDPVPDVAVLRRMLNNLKRIYYDRQDWERLLRTSNQILAVTPDDPDEHFPRGLALAGLEAWREAVEELERYLTLRPDAANRDAVLDMLSDLRARLR